MGRREIERKGYQLFISNKVKLELESEKRIFFSVKSREKHSVIFDKEKGKWECDCAYFSIKGKECSHIIACKFYLRNLLR